MMIILSTTYIIFLLLPPYLHGQTQPDCASVKCPERLICQRPKIAITLPDPRNPGCCTKTVCTCKGTSNGRSQTSYGNRYENLKYQYTNCTLVDGNLEITNIDGVRIGVNSIDFTKHIEEVIGYVLISNVKVHHIDLSSLYLIRGVMPYQHSTSNSACQNATMNTNTNSSDLYSLYVSQNSAVNVMSGLQELWLPNLREIKDGNVRFEGNTNLCYVHTIKWVNEILLKQQHVFDDSSLLVNCSCPTQCNDSTSADVHRCWGNSASLCQTYSKSICRGCGGRCNKRGNCCSDECAAGCLDDMPERDRPKFCHTCKNLNNNGKCVSTCDPPMDPNTGVIRPSERGLQFTRYCVSECPASSPQSSKFCRTYCPLGTFDFDNNICTTCEGGKCENICYGLGVNDGPLKNDRYINSRNIKKFHRNCTIIEGSLVFERRSFFGDSFCNIPPLGNQADFEVFQNVKEITGYLSFDAWPFFDMCTFKNLRKIQGKELFNDAYSLRIYTTDNKFKEPCLNSLKSIGNGGVTIADNPELCFIQTVNWSLLRNISIPNQIYGNRNKVNCAPCHEECSDGCWGREATQCVACKNFMDITDGNGKLYPEWVTDGNNQSYPGNNVTTCVSTCDKTKGVYASKENICLPCHFECASTCNGSGPSNCTSCKNFELDGECVAKCPPITHYVGQNNTCQRCSSQCIDGGCDGPVIGTDGCTICHFSVDQKTNQHTYRGRGCSICPQQNGLDNCQHGCTSRNSSDNWLCYIPPSTHPDESHLLFILFIIPALLLISLIVGWRFHKHLKTIKRMQQTIGETMVGEHIQPDSEEVPLTPSGTAPNQAQLRIVKEDELVMGKLLGSGAFGAVHKAIWTPLNIEGKKIKIAVAVKALKMPEEVSNSANNEIMDEAYVMASVDNLYLVRLLGVVMTEYVSLITQLMPLGSLLEYVRDPKNHSTMHARQMLTWFVQIAKGMLHLQEKHLVHRDLAARNVLVKTPNHVKITDFGLAKMLDVKEDTYQAEGGKLPIKWLAIECITERTFSHYSDVWAYGITCWELLTNGARPYEGVRAIDILSLLERGERLQQPSSATIDVYLLLVKCWMVDRYSRPSFAELASEFSRMSTDPKRYLVMEHESSNCILSPNPADEDRFFRQLMEDEDNGDALIADEPDQYLLCNDATSLPLYENQTIVRTAEMQDQSQLQEDGKRLFSRSTISASRLPPISSSSAGELKDDKRVNSNFDPDDVFSEMENSTKVVGQNANSAQGPRKDSDDAQRYTEDPTTKKSSFTSNGVNLTGRDDENHLKKKGNSFSADEHAPRELDRMISLTNATYVEDLSFKDHSRQISEQGSCRRFSSKEQDYVNTDGGRINQTWYSNEECIATDSGIEDVQSLLSGSNTVGRYPRQISEFSSLSEGDRVIFKDAGVHFNPDRGINGSVISREDGKWSPSSGTSSSSTLPGTAVDNPEYMLLNPLSSNDENLHDSIKQQPNPV